VTSTLASRRRAQANWLEDRFHLTHSEACLVLHLVEGASLKSSAETLGVTYETVRSYLKSAFLKTETHRQTELVLKAFHVLSDPHPPAQVPAAMSALELRTAVHEQGEPSDV
jgi:DNA-binding CsgD family transcriptional regulator